MSSIEEWFLKIKLTKEKLNNLTKGEQDAIYSPKNEKTIVVIKIAIADKGSAIILLDRRDCFKGS